MENELESALFYLLRNDLLEEVLPLHSIPRSRTKADGTLDRVWKRFFRNDIPVDDIREYFGDTVAVYFEWMKHYARWLLFPAAASLIIFFASSALELPVEANPIASVYSFFMAIWATLFILVHEPTPHLVVLETAHKRAERRMGQLQQEAGGRKLPSRVQRHKAHQPRNREDGILFYKEGPLPTLRPEFPRHFAILPVHYFRYDMVKTFVLTLCSFLNLNGYVKDGDKSFIYIPRLATLAMSG